jgi:ferredoxin--NADP+ reductase
MFTAEALLEQGCEVEIDIIERMPVPYGLVRFGVAPDHPQTKTVTDRFDQILSHPAVALFANLEVGRDVALVHLLEMYDAVVLATGAPGDTPLDLPGSDLPGVYGAAQFVGWYNGHPDFQQLSPVPLGSAVAVIGLGNVALDIARLLASSRARLERTDIADAALDAICAAGVTDVYIVGRRGALDARFTNAELHELEVWPDVVPTVERFQLPQLTGAQGSRTALRNLKTFWDFANTCRSAPRRIHFVFRARPVQILGGERVTGLRVMRDGTEMDIACGTVVAAIGHRSSPIAGVAFDAQRGIVPSDNARVENRLYAAGWIRRGPSGVIGTNKPDGVLVATRIVAECPAAGRPGRLALEEHVRESCLKRVDLDGWRRIDATERGLARNGAARRKLTSIPELLAAASG